MLFEREIRAMYGMDERRVPNTLISNVSSNNITPTLFTQHQRTFNEVKCKRREQEVEIEKGKKTLDDVSFPQ